MDLLHQVSDFLSRKLSPEKVESIRTAYFGTRNKLAPLIKSFYGTFDTADLKQHLASRIDDDFEILMVHGSFNHMLPAYTGNALELVRMLIKFCGPDRTLAMPAFFFGDPKIGTVNQTFQANPRFDLRRTASQMGLFTELFRRSQGVIQSRHPVYRVSALGPLAEELTRGHDLAATPGGMGTPFEFMAARKTKILGLGKSFHVMTQVHHVDDLLGEDFPAPRAPADKRSRLQVLVIDGANEYPVTLVGNGIHWRFNIEKLPKLLKPGDLSVWKFHNVPMFCADATKVTEQLVAMAKQGQCLYDPV
jgi:aminoglycoside 3-N-acetyltransferase